MVGVQNNIQNPPVKKTELHVGVLVPPDKFHKPIIYSDREATQQFRQLNRDVCEMQKKISFEETKKTPKSVWCILGAGVLAAIGFGIRALVKRKG